MPVRNHLDVVGHRKFDVSEVFSPLLPINNIVIKAKKPGEEWLQESMELVGEWRAIFRSIYIKWSLALNGLNIAMSRYSDPDWHAEKQFFVTSLRSDEAGRAQSTQIAMWDGPEVVKNHRAVIPYLAVWGIIDLGSALEEFIFDLYRVYLWQNPQNLLQGPEYKDLRILNADSSKSKDDNARWETAFTARLDDWQHKVVYGSKAKVFLAYCNLAGLKTPSIYTQTTINTWADCLNGVCILRNCLIHPNAKVPKELGDFAASKLNIGYDFKEGDPLQVTLKDLQCTECFLDQLLTGLNLSLVERTGAKLPAKKEAL